MQILILPEVLLKIKYPGFFLLHNSISNKYANFFNPFSILSIEVYWKCSVKVTALY